MSSYASLHFPGQRLPESRWLALAVALVSIVCALWAPSAAAKWDTLPSDRKQWQYVTAGRIVVIGDIHGDLNALIAILQDRGVIDAEGRWQGGTTELVLMGDLLDRGPDSRAVMDLVMRLQAEAAESGGRVHALLGNHEMMVLAGDVRYVTAEEAKAFAEFKTWPQTAAIAAELGIPLSKAAVVAALRHHPLYAPWLARRNSVIKINDTLFAHAGVEAWLAETGPGAVNTTVRAWAAYYQGAAAGVRKPARKYAWVIDEQGPLWTRALAEGSLLVQQLKAWLAAQRAKRLVVGHSVTADGRIALRYDGSVYMVDTGNSAYYDGGLSALEIVGQEVLAHDGIKRPKLPLAATRAEYARRASCRGLSLMQGFAASP